MLRIIAFLLILFTNFGCSGLLSERRVPVISTRSTDIQSPPRPLGMISKLDEIALTASRHLKEGNFAELEKLTGEARRSGERLPGGYFVLYALHKGLSLPNPGQNSAEPEWDAHFSRLESWKTSHESSVSARVAAGESWINWAAQARGNGYSSTVSDESWKLFAERNENASEELGQAGKLLEKCPQWYSAMLSLGLAQGMPSEKYEELFEEAFAFAPTYYHIQRQKIIFLLPEYHGSEGDVAKFIEANSARIEGEEGQIMYFLLASTLQPTYRGDFFMRVKLSMDKLKTGYLALQGRYGADRYRKNQFAYLAITGGDFDSGAAAMKEVGDDWDPEVWSSRERFEVMKRSMKEFEKVRSSLRSGKADS